MSTTREAYPYQNRLTRADVLTALQGHQLIDPAHIDNHTGRWLIDGQTASTWAQSSDAEAPHLTRILTALDQRVIENPYRPWTGEEDAR